jgi:acetyltransferase-like isoleucine patch superfamily enzyme
VNLKKLQFLLNNINAKTVYFNFKKFPFAVARKFPVFVSKHVILKDITGNIKLPDNFYMGVIRLGFGEVGIFDKQRSRTIWEVKGTISFAGSAFIGHGSKISVGKDGKLTLGSDFSITAESSIVCFDKISIGDRCLFSWQILMMDTDFHKILGEDKKVLNGNKEITIGSNVWIGARATILKGSTIANGCIVAANSLVSGQLVQPGSLYGGQPAKLLKENIQWEL